MTFINDKSEKKIQLILFCICAELLLSLQLLNFWATIELSLELSLGWFLMVLNLLVCQLVWDGVVLCAVVQLCSCWVRVEREFSQLRRNERAGGQPPAFDPAHNHTNPQPNQPIQMHCLPHLNKEKRNFKKFLNTTKPTPNPTNPFKCTHTVFDNSKMERHNFKKF